MCLDTPVGTLDLGVSPAGAETVSCFQTLFYLFVLYLLFWVVDLQGLEPGTDRL